MVLLSFWLFNCNTKLTFLVFIKNALSSKWCFIYDFLVLLFVFWFYLSYTCKCQRPICYVQRNDSWCLNFWPFFVIFTELKSLSSRLTKLTSQVNVNKIKDDSSFIPLHKNHESDGNYSTIHHSHLFSLSPHLTNPLLFIYPLGVDPQNPMNSINPSHDISKTLTKPLQI